MNNILRRTLATFFVLTFLVSSVKFTSNIIERYRLLPLKNFDNVPILVKEDDTRPVEISIPAINIRLPINQAYIKEGNWTFDGHGAQYLVQSPLPGEAGNSIMFGHNFPNTFGNLNKLKEGDVISITMNDGKIIDFEVEFMQSVTADQTNILDPTQDTRLTLFTCTGFLDLKRLVIVAVPQEG